MDGSWINLWIFINLKRLFEWKHVEKKLLIIMISFNQKYLKRYCTWYDVSLFDVIAIWNMAWTIRHFEFWLSCRRWHPYNSNDSFYFWFVNIHALFQYGTLKDRQIYVTLCIAKSHMLPFWIFITIKYISFICVGTFVN